MLEQFHVPDEVAHRVEPEALTRTATALFVSAGVPEDDAWIAARVLVAADLRGVDSHGVSNKLRDYLRDIDAGKINPRPNWRIVRETPACATIDADRGLGVVVAPRAMEIAITKGKATGAGLVTVANGRHLGMAAYHAMMALEHDMIGQCMTACGPRVAPTFSAEAGFGTNPIAIAAPAATEAPFVFDAATSAVAQNKIGIARRLGIDLEAGWVTIDGTPIMQPTPIPANFHLLPIGATREMGSHKGYSLGMVVDILGGLLNGSPAGPLATRGHNNHFLAAYDIEAFIDPGAFKAGMDAYLQSLTSLQPAPGHSRVLYAGVEEHEEQQLRRVNGIPLHPEVVDWFETTCQARGVNCEMTSVAG